MAKTEKQAKAERQKKAEKSAAEQKFSKEQYLEWFEQMLVMRRFEERAGQMLMQGKFTGFCHLYIGQEAVTAGMGSSVKKDDKVITAYRDHVHPIALGMEPKYVMAELFGKKTGCSKGKGGSMHMFDKSRNLFGGHGIVGAHIPLGAGMAKAEKQAGTWNAILCFLGDGAARQGAFHETMNMAMTWKLPVVFAIENNRYAMGTAVENISNVTELYELASAYKMPAEQVDGMSVEACHEAFEDAMGRARNKEGPTLLEINTYRYKGHSASDPATYRTKDELEYYQSQDPIEKVRKTIKDRKHLSKEKMDEMEKKVVDRIKEAIEFADNSDRPDPEELYDDIYTQEDYPFIREY